MGLAAVRLREEDGIETLEELDLTIKLIGLREHQIKQIEINADIQIKKLKEAAQDATAEAMAEKDRLFTMCHVYMLKNRDKVLGTKKTKILNYGTAGFRRIPPKIAIPGKGRPEMEDLCDRIEEEKASSPDSGFNEVTIHVERSVAQADLKLLTDEELWAVELVRQDATEQFFVTADKTKLVEVVDA